MTDKSLHLRKLLKFLSLADQKLTTELRKELRAERRKLDGLSGGGGDFHGPFWADVKAHVIGLDDLRELSEARIGTSSQRRRLYPELAHGFLSWFDDLKRSTNEQVGWHEGNVHQHKDFPELGLTLKVDNLLSLQIGNDRFRLIYPYFSEAPILNQRWARIGLWLMSEALVDHDISTMEVLDVLRGRSFSGARLFLQGDEEHLFVRRYSEVIAEWDSLRPEYGL